MFTVIVAADSNNGIGKNNNLPWRLKGDMKYFKEKTTTTTVYSERNVVIMGRNTWVSIPEKFRPLPDRLNIVLSNNHEFLKTLPEGVVGVTSLDSALDYCKSLQNINNVFVIGGAILYKEAFTHPECFEILLTRINKSFECDTFIPVVDQSFVLVSQNKQIENDIEYSFDYYRKVVYCL